MAAAKKAPAKTETPAAPAHDYAADLVAALAEKGVDVELRPNPTGRYSTILMRDGSGSIGYVHHQTDRRKGILVELKRELVADAAGIKRSATALAAVAARRAKNSDQS